MSSEKKKLLQLLIAFGFIAIGIAGFLIMKASRKELVKQKPALPTPIVRTITIQTGALPILVSGEGTVRPLQEITLVPQVAGKIVSLSDALVDGGVFRDGDELLRIEPADYELAVTLAEARVKNAESGLRMAEEETAAAREEWRLLRGDDPEGAGGEPPPLVAREPQLAAARAQLEADRSNLRKALLDLDRTRLRAPFDGRVGRENIDAGQYVTPGQALATIFSTEAAEIMVPLEDEDLAWIDVPGFTSGDGPGSAARVEARVAGLDRSWQGQVVRAEGRIDELTRMVNTIVRVDAPYASRPPLAIGLFVGVQIEGRAIPGAARIPRAALHPGSLVWVLEGEGVLRFCEVDVALAQGDEVIISAGLSDGDRVVVTSLKAVTNGMRVRTLSAGRGDES